MQPDPAAPRSWAALGILLGCTLLSLGAGYALKAQCLDLDWDGTQYRRYCYTDLLSLYGARGFDRDLMPYVDHGDAVDVDGRPAGSNEYPALTGILQYLAAVPADDNEGFLRWNALYLGVAALATTVCLWATGVPPRRVLAFALAPALALYFVHNWDLYAVAFLAAGCLALSRDRATLAGILWGLGAAAKVYPGMLVIPAAAWLWGRHGWKSDRLWGLVLGCGAAVLAVNVPFLVLNPEGWWYTYRFHLDRDPNFESLWFGIGHLARAAGLEALDPGKGFVDKVSALAVAGALGWSSWAAWRGRLHWLQAGAVVVLAFLIVNKVFSVQYVLWVLPFLVLLRLPAWSIALVLAADVFVNWALFRFLYLLEHPQGSDNGGWVVVAGIFLRAAALVVLLALSLRAGPAWPERPPPARVAGTGPEAAQSPAATP